ncbi:hypothetical protein MBLNU230_g3123t1 [Neophaeotheca triangularis]
MFGPFKPSAPLSGGLLWKVPWRLSPPQKLRQRRRLRRVDNVVTTLDNALQRQAASTSQQSGRPDPHSPLSNPKKAPNNPQQQSGSTGKATPSELSQTAQGQRILRDETELEGSTAPPPQPPQSGHSHALSPVHSMPGRQVVPQRANMLGTIRPVERWKATMPTEQEMLPKDKYSMFDRKARGYRKGIHKLPKWTRLSQRVNPPGF